MASELNKKFNLIFNYERFIGNSVALRVIESKPIGVWEFLIPVVFILHFMRNKQSREVFIQNYMFTKQHALEGARRMIKKGQSKEDALSAARDRTRALLTASETQGIYSEKIRQKQLNEIALLVDHYTRLLKAEGDDYDALARYAYGDRKSYLLFHKQLVSAEKNVSEAARQTLGGKADLNALLKIETVTEDVRRARIQKIFGN